MAEERRVEVAIGVEVFGCVDEGGGCGSLGDGSAFDDRAVVVVVAEIVDPEVAGEEDDDDDWEALGARMKSAANAIQPVYAKLTIVLMSVRSYLYTTHHTTFRSVGLSMIDSVDR